MELEQLELPDLLDNLDRVDYQELQVQPVQQVILDSKEARGPPEVLVQREVLEHQVKPVQLDLMDYRVTLDSSEQLEHLE